MPKGKPSKLNLQVRAEWLLDRWQDRPVLFVDYQGSIREVRKQFECGVTIAEQTIKTARQILSDRGKDPAHKERMREWVEQQYVELADRAERRGNLSEKRKVLDSLTRLRGLAAPQEVKVIEDNLPPLEDLSEEQLALIAKLDQRKRGDDDSGAE